MDQQQPPLKRRRGRPPKTTSTLSKAPGYAAEQTYVHTVKEDVEKANEGVVKPTFDDKVPFEASKHAHLKYPPPKNNPVFIRKWRELVSAIVERDNFKSAHLFQLEVLCDLFVDYESLSEFIRVHGHTYESVGRNGRLVKNYPQVIQLNRVLAEIRNYSRVLNIMLSKDKEKTDVGEGALWE